MRFLRFKDTYCWSEMCLVDVVLWVWLETVVSIGSDYKDYCTDTTVRFVVRMSADNLSKAEQAGLHRTFKLQTTLSISSMVWICIMLWVYSIVWVYSTVWVYSMLLDFEVSELVLGYQKESEARASILLQMCCQDW